MRLHVKHLLLVLLYPLSALAIHPTQIIVYQAFVHKNTLHPYLLVAERYSGTCLIHSVALPGRADAWQCHASNMILDPCFQDGRFLVCTISPWSHKVAVLELKSPLPGKTTFKGVNTHAFLPWAIALKNGTKCTFAFGPSITINNLRVNYTCNTYLYHVIGDIDKSSVTWKANVYHYNSKRIEKMDINVAWF